MGKFAKVSPELPPAVKGSTQPPSGQQGSSSSPATTSKSVVKKNGQKTPNPPETSSKSQPPLKPSSKAAPSGLSSSKAATPGTSTPKPESAGASSSKKPLFPWSRSKPEEAGSSSTKHEPPKTNAVPPKTGLTYADGKIIDVPIMTKAETPPPQHVRSRPITAPPVVERKKLRTPVRVAPAEPTPRPVTAPPAPQTPEPEAANVEEPPPPPEVEVEHPPPSRRRKCNLWGWILLSLQFLAAMITLVAMVLAYVAHFESSWTLIVGTENGTKACELANGRHHRIPQHLVFADGGGKGSINLEKEAEKYVKDLVSLGIQTVVVGLFEGLKRLPLGLGIPAGWLDGIRRQWNLRMDSMQSDLGPRRATLPPYHLPPMPVLRVICPIEPIPMEIACLTALTVFFVLALILIIVDVVALALGRTWITKFWWAVFSFLATVSLICAGALMITSAVKIDKFLDGLAEIYPDAFELVYVVLKDGSARTGDPSLLQPVLAYVPFLGPRLTEDLAPVLQKFSMTEDGHITRKIMRYSLKLAAGGVAIGGGCFYALLVFLYCSFRYYHFH